MKSLYRIAALILLIAQLFVISAAAAGAPASSFDKMKAAANDKTASSAPASSSDKKTAANDKAAAGVPASSADKMKAAPDSKTAKSSGAAEGSTAAEKAEKAAKEKEAAAALAAKKAADDKNSKVDYEIAPVTKFGTEEDVLIGGLRIQPGVWYTVDSEGVLTSSKPWPNSYLYYSASQSKLTLHEFHYKVPTDTIGKESTYAALYLPKDMHVVLEGDNELINNSYTTAGGVVSNGVYAPVHHISFEGNGALYVNTRSADGTKGYGIDAGSIRIDSEFTGLSVFGMTSAFSCVPTVEETYGKNTEIAALYSGYEDYVRVSKELAALANAYGFVAPDILSAALSAMPSVPQGREMLANVADLHPGYHEGVRVREASPYDQSIFTRFRYVLFVVGGELSWEKEMRAKIEAEYYRNKMEYNLGVEQGYAEASGAFYDNMGSSLIGFGKAVDQGIADYNNNANAFWEENSAASQLAQMLMGGN